MSKLTKFETILYECEENSITQKQLSKLLDYLKDEHVYDRIFDSYISRRLHANIHPDRLLNLAYNMEKNEATKHLSKSISNRLADAIILSDEGYDQFYFMNRHDTRIENHVFKSLVERIGENLDSKSMDIAAKIAPNINMDKYLLMIEAIDVVEFGGFRIMMFMERLSLEDQYMLAAKALESHNPSAPKLLRLSNKKLHEYISTSIADNGDNDSFATALRNTTISIEELENNDFIFFLLNKNGDHMPATMGRLYIRAEQEKRYEYLLTVCAHKNKKDVLRTICKAQDKKLIDKFFSIYKDHPEVKHLVPFL